MAKSVSNDALWEKLLEISGQLKSLLPGQKTPVSGSEQVVNVPDLDGVKNEIFAKIESEANLLGKHGDNNYDAINENIASLDKIVRKVWSIVARIRKQQREAAESGEPLKAAAGLQSGKTIGTDSNAAGSWTDEPDTLLENGRKEYFNFRFFKVRKTTLVIILLGLLVLLLTLFCMKQQNDYTLLINEHHRQETIIQQPHD